MIRSVPPDQALMLALMTAVADETTEPRLIKGGRRVASAPSPLPAADPGVGRRCVAPREWTRTIDRTGNNRLLYH
jgi:hypothetical protein